MFSNFIGMVSDYLFLDDMMTKEIDLKHNPAGLGQCWKVQRSSRYKGCSHRAHFVSRSKYTPAGPNRNVRGRP